MSRRRGQNQSDGDFAKPIVALLLLGLLYIAYEFGVIAWIVDIPVGILRGNHQ